MRWRILLVILVNVAPFHFSQKLYDDLEDIQASRAYFGANTVRTFTGKLWRSNKKHSYWVTFSPNFDAQEAVKGLELSLFWQPEYNTVLSKTYVKFTISELKDPKRPLNQVTKVINHQHTGIYNFRLKTSISHNKTKSLLVKIDLIDLKGEEVLQEYRSLNGNVTQATLIVYTKDDQQRAKREAEARRSDPERRNRRRKINRRLKNERKEPCHLQEYTVSFEDIGWHKWVLTPESVQMNLCVGHCSTLPLPGHLEPSNHAVMQNHYHHIHPTIHPPCCIPIEYSNLPLIIKQSNGTVKLIDVDKMIVTRCGCR